MLFPPRISQVLPGLPPKATNIRHDAEVCLFSFRNNPQSQPMISLDFPAPLQQRVINALKADPKTVDLRAQAPHFYALGARILDLFEDEDVVDVLLDVRNSMTGPQQPLKALLIPPGRLSKSVRQRSQTTRTTSEAHWVKVRIS